MAERTCSVDSCDKKVAARGWCEMHYMRWRRHGDVLTVLPNDGFSRTGAAHPMWRDDDISYNRAHSRVTEERGRASEYPCVDCGTQAQEWSYNHSDPDERRGLHHGSLKSYSTDTSNYDPRCRVCHKRFDKYAAADTGPEETET